MQALRAQQAARAQQAQHVQRACLVLHPRHAVRGVYAHGPGLGVGAGREGGRVGG
jgi:hypothetical protein